MSVLTVLEIQVRSREHISSAGFHFFFKGNNGTAFIKDRIENDEMRRRFPYLK